MALDAQTQAVLAQLQDIQIPDPVTWWPLANSVWALLVGFMGILVGLSWYHWQRHKNNRYRREAQALLKQTLRQDLTAPQKIMALNHLLKQVAITNYGRNRVAALTGQAWVDFLKETASYIEQPANLVETLTAAYQPQVSPDVLQSFEVYCLAWIKGHHK